ncbi:MAG: transposase [Bacteroidales bacterium]
MFEKSLDDDQKRAEYAMTEIQKLYQIERRAREQKLTPEQRHTLRLDESLPILNELGKWIAAQVRTTMPKSPFGKALIYSVGRWDNLMHYLKDGYLEIDNNLVENSIRPTALGKKNYLFAGSHASAQSAAMFYSFFGTCKLNNVDPFTWLKKVLEIIPDYPANKLSDLLPQNLDLSS